MSELIVHSTEPFNAEPTLARLRERFLTPERLFYVRSHGPVPRPDPASYRLRLHGLLARPALLSLSDLRSRFRTRRGVVTLQCAGNRRADLGAMRRVSGDPWAGGAIGTAEWEGVALADVLEAAGVEAAEIEQAGGRHVAFHALDRVETDGSGAPYAVSIPLARARLPDVLLAWAMNGEALTPEHGFPLRAIVPGYAGVRSAKWLGAIEVRDSPAEGPMQRTEYRLYPADVTEETADPACAMTIDEMPLNSAICEPAPGSEVTVGQVRVRGYAVAGSRSVSRVELSADGGRSWVQTRLEPGACPGSWILWETELDLAPGPHELVARAWDCAGQTQPSAVEQVWNFKGYLCNAWHRVRIEVRPG